MGMASGSPRSSALVVDPEATLLLTWSVGRCDPRIFDTGLAWCIEHGDLIDVTRLRALLRTADAETASIGAAWSSHVAPAFSTWARLSQSIADSGQDPRPVFLDGDGRAMGSFGALDARFLEQGWARGEASGREGALSRPPMSGTNLRFRLRKLLGVGARPEVVAILLMRDQANSADLARLSGYSKRAIQLVLADLHSAGVVRWSRRRGQTNPISIRREVWQGFLETAPYDDTSAMNDLADVRWRDTPQIFGGLIRTWRATLKLTPAHLSSHARITLLNDAIHHLFTTAEWVHRKPLPGPHIVGRTEHQLVGTFEQLSADIFGQL